jgi:hypothetical protein
MVRDTRKREQRKVSNVRTYSIEGGKIYKQRAVGI